MTKNYVIGFIKQAMDRGYTSDDAVKILKMAFDGLSTQSVNASMAGQSANLNPAVGGMSPQPQYPSPMAGHYGREMTQQSAPSLSTPSSGVATPSTMMSPAPSPLPTQQMSARTPMSAPSYA